MLGDSGRIIVSCPCLSDFRYGVEMVSKLKYIALLGIVGSLSSHAAMRQYSATIESSNWRIDKDTTSVYLEPRTTRLWRSHVHELSVEAA